MLTAASLMKAIFSIFPKFFDTLSIEELAALVREVGLDTVNMVVRDGYWVTEADLAVAAPAFVKAMATAGIHVHFCAAGFSAQQMIEDETPLKILADNGITAFRMGYFFAEDGETPAVAMDRARGEMEEVATICGRIGIKAVYQVHHGMLIASPSAVFYLTRDLPEEAVGVMLDPGNQGFEGFEEWYRSVPLIGTRLRAIGVKDVTITRNPSEHDKPAKGWKHEWAPIDEGLTNWHALCHALGQINFDGTFIWMPFVEPEDQAANIRIIKREVAYLRGILAEVTSPGGDAFGQ